MPGTYVFGPFRFETQHRLLYRKEERLPLTPKAADLLLLLLERQGQVIGKEELLRLVWPDSFVEEGNLSKHIFNLRKTLENGDGLEYIETIPKRGYRFVAPVERTDTHRGAAVVFEEGAREQIVIEETDERPTRNRFTYLTITIAVCVVIAAAALAGVVLMRQSAGRNDVAVRSVLVMPFANLSGHAEEEYFSDGLTEELIENLTGVSGVRVIPRSTAFQFKGKAADVRELGKRFHVDTVIEGAVRRDPERLRITLRLLRATDGRAFWTRTFDRPIESTIPTQEEVARAVLNAISVTETADPANPGPGTSNLEAYNKVLRARFLAEQFWGDTLDRALQLYKEAAALDPNYAEAWAGQAFCYSVQAQLFLKPVAEAYRAADASALHALAANPRCVRAHNVLGQDALVYHHDWATARKEFDAALTILPDDGWTLHASSHYWMALGRADLAERDGKRGLAVDPLNGPHNAHQVWMHMMAGRYSDALARADEVFRDFGRDHRYTLIYVLNIYERTGRLKEALEVRRRLGEPADLISQAARALDGGDRADYYRIFARNIEAGHNGWPIMAVELYAILGDRDAMYRALKNAIDRYDPNVIQLNADPVFAPYRSEPRFRELMRAVHIPNV